MDLDTRTLILVLSLSNGMMGFVLLWVIGNNRDDGSGLWIVSLFMKAVATGCLLLPQSAPGAGFLFLYAIPLVLTSAYAVNYAAVCAFLGVRKNARLASGLIAAAVLVLLVWGQDPYYSVVGADLVRAGLIAVIVHTLQRHGQIKGDRAHGLLLVGFLLAMAVFVVRAVTNAVDPITFASFDRSSMGRSMTFLVSITVSILTSFGLVLMFRGRSAAMLAASENQLRKFKAIIDSSDDAILSKTPAGVITSWNVGAQKMFGFAAAEVVGQPVQVLIPPDRADEERRILQKVAAGEHVEHFETMRFHKGGQRLDVSVSVSPVRNEHGAIVGASSIARDITQRKRMELALRQHSDQLEAVVAERTKELVIAKQAAEAANQAKSLFLANMSHELRTPLHGMMGMMELASWRATDPAQQGYINRAQQASRHLLAVLSDILDISRIEANRLPLESKDFYLPCVIEDVVGLLGLDAERKGLALRVDVDPRLIGLCVRGDPMRLRQIVLNMVGNAIKFTSVGAVAVRVLIEMEAETDLSVRVEVEDTGIGIAAENVRDLFTPFHQVDFSTTRSYGGTGLGLAISKRLTQAMGGHIGLTSQPEQGSTFWFTAPLTKAVVKPEFGESWTRSGVAARVAGKPEPYVLLVEDEPLSIEVGLALLAKLGVGVDVARDGVEAIEAIQSGGHRYDAILMDMQMARMGGLEATRELRRMGVQIPIVALTARAFADDRRSCEEAGMSDFIAKPVDPDALRELLRKWVPGTCRKA